MLATFMVNTVNDTPDANVGDGMALDAAGNTSLRAAIQEANANGIDDTIRFATAMTITLTVPDAAPESNPDLDINDAGGSLLIDGAGQVTILGTSASRVFEVFSEATISGLTISNGQASNGGGILVNGGDLTLRNSEVSFNTATGIGGGGIRTTSSGTLTVVSSTIANNSSMSDGGGLANENGTVTIINSTLSGNRADADGGAVLSKAITMILNSTLTGNTANADGVSSGNGGGIRAEGTETMENTIVAGNTRRISVSATAADDIELSIETAFHSLIGDFGTRGGIAHDDDGDPMAGTNNIVGNAGTGTIDINTVLNTTLADNGGPTQTHALVGTSPALNAGDNARLPADTFDLDGDSNKTEPIPFDQRGMGFDRIRSGIVDIGAFELQVIPPVLANLAPSVVFLENTVNAAAQIIDADVAVSDLDSADFSGGNLTVSYTALGLAEDQLSIRNHGTGTGQIGFSGETVTFSGGAIGTVSAPNNGTNGADLIVNLFSASATPEAVEALIENLTYQNTSDTPTLARTISLTIDDGDGGTSTAQTTQINVTAEADPMVITGTAGGLADTFRISFEDSRIVVRVNDMIQSNRPLEEISSITLTGTDDDDAFVIDFADNLPIPAGGIFINGGGQQTAAGDSLTLLNGTFPSVTYVLNNDNTGNGAGGSIDFGNNGVDITFTGLEPVVATGVNTNDVTFTIDAGVTAAFLEDAGTPGSSQLRFEGAMPPEDVIFANPANSLTINLQGNSTVTLRAMDDGYAPTTVTFNGMAGSNNLFQVDSLTGVLPDVSNLVLQGNASLDLNGVSDTIGSLAGDAASTVLLGSATLTTGGNNASTTYAGVISGTGGVTKQGSGTFTISGANMYSGTTRIEAGTLQLGAAGVLNDNGTVELVTGSGTQAFDLNGNNETIGALNVASGQNVTLGSGTLTFGTNTATSTIDGVISGTGGIRKQGSQEAVLNGINTYTGTTEINVGIMTLNGQIGNSGPAGTVSIASGVTLNSSGTVNAAILGAAGSMIVATGNTSLGDGSTSGFSTDGTLAVGSHIVTLRDANAAMLGSSTTLAGGTLVAANGASVSSGGLISGTGTIDVGTGARELNVNLATVSPGTSPGLITVDGDFDLAGGNLNIELDGAAGPGVAGGHDQVDVNNGGVVLATLLTEANLNLTLNFVPLPGTSFVIIDNDGTDPVIGTFTQLNGAAESLGEGAPFTLTETNSGAAIPFTISYAGGTDNNDVVITAVRPTTVYVDDNFANPVTGEDPDGGGPATIFGYDAFATIQDGVNAIAPGAANTVVVNAGTYEQVTIDKDLTLDGASGTAADVTITPDSGDGVIITSAADNVTLSDFQVMSADDDGIDADGLTTFIVNNVRPIDNAGDGFEVTNSGAVSFTNVVATGNDPGVFMNGVASFSDTDGNYSDNDDHGIQLVDISGNVTLTRTTLNNNDADNSGAGDGTGDGLNATDGGDGDSFAIGGDLIIRGATIQDTDGAGTGATQQHGVFVSGLGGTLMLLDSAGPAQSNIVTGNRQSGITVQTGTTAAIVNGTYSGNLIAGLNLTGFTGIQLTDVTAEMNGIGLAATSTGTISVLRGSFSNNSTGVQAAAASLTINNSFLTGNSIGLQVSGATDATINESDLSGSMVDFIRNLTANTVDAQFNFFGLGIAADDTIAAQPAGPVDFTPYLDSGDANGTLAGFQADYSVLNVTILGEQLPAGAGRIQQGIDEVNAGGTLNISDGTFMENVVIAKNVTLNGSGSATIIDPLANNALMINDGASNLTIQNLRITGTDDGIIDNSTATIASLTLSNLVIDTTSRGGALDGVTNLNVALTDNDDTANVTDTTFSSTDLEQFDYLNVTNFSFSGGTGSDTFNVDPISSTMLTINGNDPMAPASPGDILDYNGPGVLTLNTPSSGTITQTGFNAVAFTGIETVATDNVTGTNGNFTITTSADADDFITRRDADNIQVFLVNDFGAEVLVFSLPFSVVNSLTLDGSDDDNRLTVDYAGGNPIPSGGLRFNGRGSGISDNDDLVIINGSAVTVTHNFVNSSNGSVVIELMDASVSTITYTGLEPITDGLGAANRVFNFAATSDLITLGDDGTTNGASRISSAATSEAVTFMNPTVTLTINAGDGDDTITLLDLDNAFNANVFVNGSRGRDTFDLDQTTGTADNLYTLNGNEGADTFNIAATPLNGPDIQINGGSPAITPGDTLNYDGSAVLDVTGPGAGNLTPADVNMQGIVFEAIEDLNTNDPLPVLSIDDPAAVLEAAGTVTFTVTLSGESLQPVTVDVATANGTAISGSDYLSVNQTLIFAPGETVKMVTVTILNELLMADAVVEATEEFIVNLSNPQGATIGDGAGVGTILDDDTALISIGGVTQLEGSTGQTNFVFTISLDKPVDAPVTLTASTAGGTATAGEDFVSNTQSLTFAAGERTKTFTVQVNADQVVELDETFQVLLSNLIPGGRDVQFSTLQATGTILDDDTAVITISNVTQLEGGPDMSNFEFTVTLDKAVDAAVMLTASTIDGTATVADNDYLPLVMSPVTFGPNSLPGATRIVSVTVKGDNVVERDETFQVLLSGLTAAGRSVEFAGGTMALNATGRILNDDSATISFVQDVTQSEADGDFVFVVRLSEEVGEIVTVDVKLAFGSAGMSDFLMPAFAPMTVEFDPANDDNEDGDNNPLTERVTVSVIDDDFIELDETFQLRLELETFAGQPADGRLTIDPDRGIARGVILNDDQAEVAIVDALTPFELPEDDAGGVFMFMVALNDADGTPMGDLLDENNRIIVDVVVVAETATGGGQDFTVSQNPIRLTFDRNNLGPQMVPVTINDDDIAEADERFEVRLVNVQFENPATGRAPDPSRVVIDTFPDDRRTGVILNDDAATLAISNVQGDEGQDFVFEVTLTGRISEDVTFTANTADGTSANPATNGVDFTAITNEVFTFFANEVSGSQTILVTVEDVDNEGKSEPEEDFEVQLSNITFGGTQVDGQPGSNQVTPLAVPAGAAGPIVGQGIINDSSGPVEIGFREIEVSASEGTLSNNTLTFLVEMIGVEQGEVTVDIEVQMTNNGNGRDAVENVDFTLATTQVVFPAGNNTAQTVTVTLLADRVVEPNETFELVIARVEDETGQENNRAIVRAGFEVATGTIFNDDFANLVISEAVATEGNTGTATMTFAVTLDREVQGGLNIDFETLTAMSEPVATRATSGMALTPGVDFLTTTGEVEFTGTVENDQRLIQVTIQGDTLTERDEVFLLNLLANTITSQNGDPIQNGDAIFIQANNNPLSTAARGTIQNDDSILVTGAGQGGGSHIRVFDQLHNEIFGVFAYFDADPTFTGGVRVATGDVNGDGTPDIITAPGPDLVLGLVGPRVRVYDGRTFALIREFIAYDPGFRGGLFVTAADVDGDGRDEIITGPDAGGGPHVRVFKINPSSVTVFSEFMAYAGGFRGGVRVATGDVNGDGKLDLITGPGAGGGPHVKVFDLPNTQGGQAEIITGGQFMAFAGDFAGGVFVAAADFNGDGQADIVVGKGSETGRVRIFDADDLSFTQINAFPGFTGGVRVATVERAGNERPDLVAAAGPGMAPIVRVFDGATINLDQFTQADLAMGEDALADAAPTAEPDFNAYNPAFMGGVFVAGTVFPPNAGSPLRLAGDASGPTGSTLSLSDLNAIASAAVGRFEQAGLDAASAAELIETRFVIRDLAPGLLGLATADFVFIDVDASGAGWFIDPTPLADEEFLSVTSAGLGATDAAALGRVDLLTVVLHEFGHILGLDDLEADAHASDLMADSLAPGIRRLPDEETLDALFADDRLMEDLLTAAT